MIPDVVSAEYQGSYRIKLTFDNGKSGVIDLSSYTQKGGVFERFKDMQFFRNFTVNKELGVLEWGDEIDIAPESLYAEATGESLPEWMEEEQLQAS